MPRIADPDNDLRHIEPFFCNKCNRTTNSTISNTSEQLDGVKPGVVHEYSSIRKQSREYLVGHAGHPLVMTHELVLCATPGCDGVRLRVALVEKKTPVDDTISRGDPPPGARGFIAWSNWNFLCDKVLLPNSQARTWPLFVPAALATDYKEAVDILDISPRASATLSRRCLQFMLRDHWKVRPDTLYREIEQIREHISVELFEAISSIRSIGNYGAHPEKDTAIIIPVDQNEAKTLVEVVEIAIEDWYLAAQEKRIRLERAAALKRSQDRS